MSLVQNKILHMNLHPFLLFLVEIKFILFQEELLNPQY